MIADTTKIKVERSTNSKLPETDLNNIQFGKVFSDHMFQVDYKDGQWQDPAIVPYQPVSLSPATSALHYGQSIFEGMKAYRNGDDIFLFRPRENAKRLNISAERMCMPALPEELFMEGLTQLIRLDAGWVPDSLDSSLYVRPFMFATDDFIGVRASNTYRFMIFTCPVNAYYSEPVRVKIEMEYSRSFEGGTGFAKAAGNYASSLMTAQKAKAEGFHQLIWTDAATHTKIEEAGTMNVVFEIGDTLISPKPSNTILAGITKESVLNIAREWGLKVEEREITVDEVVTALKNGTMKDAFGAGTAATIAHISHISHLGTEYVLPPVKERGFSNKAQAFMDDLKRGIAEDKFDWVLSI